MSSTQWKADDTQKHFNDVAAKYEKSTGGATRVIARHLVEYIPPLRVGTKILDNATGTGILIEELLATIKDSKVRATINITAADQGPAMIDLLESKVSRWNIRPEQVHTETLAAEDLGTLPADAFDLSFTVFGFMFFKDPEVAAKHVYRTLKPGGTAYITTWADLGYLKAINAAGSNMGRQDVKMPFGDEWFTAEHLKTLFEGAGFEEVNVYHKNSAYTADSVQDLAARMMGMLGPLLKPQGWDEDIMEKLPSELEKAFGDYGEDVLKVDGSEVRLQMVANVAVCKK